MVVQVLLEEPIGYALFKQTQWPGVIPMTRVGFVNRCGYSHLAVISLLFIFWVLWSSSPMGSQSSHLWFYSIVTYPLARTLTQSVFLDVYCYVLYSLYVNSFLATYNYFKH